MFELLHALEGELPRHGDQVGDVLPAHRQTLVSIYTGVLEVAAFLSCCTPLRESSQDMGTRLATCFLHGAQVRGGPQHRLVCASCRKIPGSKPGPKVGCS